MGSGERFVRDPRYARAGDTTQARALEVGDRVWFSDAKRAWTVRARGLRYIIVTQPFNPRRTVLYAVIDLELGIRGRDNYGGLGYETDEDIASSMAMFDSGRAEISARYHGVTLDIVRMEAAASGGGERRHG